MHRQADVMRASSLGNWLYALIPAAVLVGALTLFHFKDPVAILFIPCPFYQLSGFLCPGCGSLRALYHLSQGELWFALSMNLLMVFFLPLIFFLVVLDLRQFTRPRVFSAGTLRAHCGWIVAGLILVFWLLRNLPLYPFSFLAPG